MPAAWNYLGAESREMLHRPVPDQFARTLFTQPIKRKVGRPHGDEHCDRPENDSFTFVRRVTDSSALSLLARALRRKRIAVGLLFPRRPEDGRGRRKVAFGLIDGADIEAGCPPKHHVG